MPTPAHAALEQPHPLYARDRAVVDRLLATATPGPQEITDASRLLIRYDGFPGARDISRDIVTAAKAWGYRDRGELNREASKVWNSGWRPTLETSQVGSGADVAAGAAAG